MKLLGIHFAPVHMPLKRRLQTLAILQFQFVFIFAPILSVVLFVALCFTSYYWVCIVYLAWLVYDNGIHHTASTGGRRYEWLRQSSMYRYFRDYFPISLVKTADLDPSKNYILGYHPHGILGCGAFGNFATEATGFSKKYPGITPFLLTLQTNFNWPLLRAYIMATGACSVTRESIEWLMTHHGTGNAAIIVIGGAEEALEARPGTYNLKLLNRKGFVKMALKTGAQLVPVFCFGENDIFVQADNPKGSYLRKFQELFKKVFSFSPPIFHGRGVFNYDYGFVPYRKPIRTVVGAPIPVEKCENPSIEQIQELHQKYTDALSDLYDQYKVKYGIGQDKHLHFL